MRGGHVVTMDPEIGTIAKGDVLIEDGLIVDVAPNVEASGVVELDATGRIVMPGFVDTHRHTWQSLIRHVATDWTLAQYFSGVRGVIGGLYSSDDMYIANLIGALEALDAGITTLVDWSHNNNTPDHADAALDGILASGIRSVFAYGNSNDEWLPVSDVPHSHDVKRIAREHFSSRDQLVTLAMALRGPQFSTAEVTRHDFELAREIGIPITVHVGDGLWGLSDPVGELHRMGQLGPDITFVHANTIADAEFDLIRESGGAVSVAPELEMHMGHGRLAALRAIERGIPTGLSIDVYTSVGGDAFSAMRSVLSASRYETNLQAIEDREVVKELPLFAMDVLEMATTGGARAAWLDGTVGMLRPGLAADVIAIRADGLSMTPLNDPVGAVIESGNPQLVDVVFVGGRLLKFDGVLIGQDVHRIRSLAETARDGLFARAGIEDPSSWIPEPYEAT